MIEIPLNKFNDEALPHYQKLFETHKSTIQKVTASMHILTGKCLLLFTFSVHINERHRPTKTRGKRKEENS